MQHDHPKSRFDFYRRPALYRLGLIVGIGSSTLLNVAVFEYTAGNEVEHVVESVAGGFAAGGLVVFGGNLVLDALEGRKIELEMPIVTPENIDTHE
jgi:hypothetical protein